MTRIDPWQQTDRKNIEFLKIQHGGGSHLEKITNRDISATVWPIFTKFGTLTQIGFLNRPDC